MLGDDPRVARERVRVVRQMREAHVAHELERLDQLFGFVRRAAELLDDGVAQERLAAQVAGVEVATVAPPQGAGELRQIDVFDGELHRPIEMQLAYRVAAHASCCSWM